MAERTGASNEISGTVIRNVVQGRDATVSLPAAVPAAVSGLPAQTVFVGRNTQLAQLANVLDPAGAEIAGRPVVVTAVAGLAGVGKTALAVRAAHDALAAGWFPGGVVMVDLRGYDPPDRRVQPTAALSSLLSALGTPSEHTPSDQADRERLWRSLLASRDAARQRMLLVLDNASSTEQVRPLLPGTSGHRVLITSRHSLADLGGARLLDVDVLSAEQAVELLQEELAAAHPGDGRVHADPRAAGQLAQLCGGLPLAIRIAAALLAADSDQPIAELAEALSTEHHRLEELNYDGSLNVRAAFDLSYQHLAREPARLLRLLALNPGPEISTEAAAALANLGTIVTRRLISELRRANLLQPGAVRGRWRMHDLLRLYAAEWAEKDENREHALDRLFRYYTATSKAAGSHIDARATTPDRDHRFTGRQKALDWLDTEYTNLTAAVTLAFGTGRYSHTVALADALYEFFALRLHVPDWITTHRYALVAARKLEDRHGEARVRIRLGSAFGRLNMDNKLAAFQYERALEIYRDLGDRRGEATALLRLGAAYQALNQYEDALDYHGQALEIYRELGDRHGEAAALNNIGLHCVGAPKGRFEDAADYYQRALQIYRDVGDRDAEAGELGNLGNLYTEIGRWEEALLCHRQALDIWRQLDYRHGQAGQMYNLSRTYREMGQPTEAAECCRQAVRLYRECRDYSAEAGALRLLGQIYRQLGQLDQAITYYQQSLQIRRQLDTIEEEAETLAELGYTLHEAERFGEAVAYWVEALDMFTELDSTHPRAKQLRTALANRHPNS